jgi:hypothetical protein
VIPRQILTSGLDALIAEMTLTEKVAQLGSVGLGFDVVTGEVAPMQNVFSRNLQVGEFRLHLAQVSPEGLASPFLGRGQQPRAALVGHSTGPRRC